MDNNAENIKRIADYIRSGEKKLEDCSIGTEFEHILVYKDTLKSVGYNDEKGTESLFRGLVEKGWILSEENQRILGATRDGDAITLEPGGQVEISIKHTTSLKEIGRRYQLFIEDVKPVLDGNGQRLLALGYHPVSTIEEIPFIPKQRYAFMSEYLGGKDVYGHHMMKGTASTQAVFDYTDEEDFMKKYRVANSLVVVLSYLFDNTPIFKGKLWEYHMARTNIWNHVDSDRSGLFEGVLSSRFGYKEYATYVWNKPVVIALLDGSYVFTREKTMKDVYGNRLLTTAEIEHVLSMFFPDVRAKRYIEIRMRDSVPYPINMALAALVKGIFYNQENLDYYYQESLDYSEADIQKYKDAMVSSSELPKILRIQAEELLARTKMGLSKEEQEILDPLSELFQTHGNMATWIKDSIRSGSQNPFELVYAT